MAFEANPVAARRSADLVIDVHGDETVVLDTRTDAVHCLPREIAAVWDACDGSSSVADIAVATGLDAEIVESSVEQLTDIRLLDAPGLDRRRFLRRSLLVGGSAVAIPVIQSIIAPAIAAAGSGDSCHAFISDVVCDVKGNKGTYFLNVSGIVPDGTYNARVVYKNGVVDQTYPIVVSGGVSKSGPHDIGAGIPHGSNTLNVDIYIYNLDGSVKCQDKDVPFPSC